MRVPSALNDAASTQNVCPLSVRSSAPVLASHTFAVLSELPVMIRVPSALNDAAFTQSVCPLSVRSSAPVFVSHTFAVLSQLPVTMRVPSALNDAAFTLFVCPLRVSREGSHSRLRWCHSQFRNFGSAPSSNARIAITLLSRHS